MMISKLLLLSILFLSARILEPKISFLSSIKPDNPELFVGAINKIKLEGFRKGGLKLILSHGEIIETKGNIYSILERSAGQDTVWVYEGRTLVKQIICPVRIIPRSIGRLGGFVDSIGTVNQVLANPFLNVDIPGSNYKHQFTITHFELSLVSKNYDTLASFQSNSHLLSNEQIKEIKKLEAGDHLYFSNVGRSCPACKGVRLAPFRFYIR